MTEKQFIPVERAIIQAKRMKLRSKEQSEIIESLIYHIDMLAITVRNQRKQLMALNNKGKMLNAHMSEIMDQV